MNGSSEADERVAEFDDQVEQQLYALQNPGYRLITPRMEASTVQDILDREAGDGGDLARLHLGEVRLEALRIIASRSDGAVRTRIDAEIKDRSS